MATFFFDTSALVKRYVTETGTNWVEALVDPVAGHNVYIARITLVELVSAVSRRRSMGSLSAADALAALNQFRSDFVYQYEIVELTHEILDNASIFAENHLLRAYDAVQLAAIVDVNNERTAAGLPPMTLISADVDLNLAATSIGLTADDPNSHP